MSALSRIISVIFHPLLLATYLFALFSVALPGGLAPLKEEGHLKFIGLIFSVTFVLPVLNFLIFKMIGSIRSLAMEHRKERIIPFSFVTILYIAVTCLFYFRTGMGLDDNLLRFLIIIDLLVFIATIVTIFYKVSVHSMGVWALIGILLPLNKVSEDGALFLPTVVAIVVAGIVMTARLQLNAHSPREVMVGGLLGVTVGLSCVIFLF